MSEAEPHHVRLVDGGFRQHRNQCGLTDTIERGEHTGHEYIARVQAISFALLVCHFSTPRKG